MITALINLFNLNHLTLRLDLVTSKYLGESEEKIRNLFQMAKNLKPCVIFIDDIDSVGMKRDNDDNGVNERVLSTLLNEMDGFAIVNKGGRFRICFGYWVYK
jgi:SpoVK/Ycf46/Vps4 family AAA+-type ATPase